MRDMRRARNRNDCTRCNTSAGHWCNGLPQCPPVPWRVPTQFYSADRERQRRRLPATAHKLEARFKQVFTARKVAIAPSSSNACKEGEAQRDVALGHVEVLLNRVEQLIRIMIKCSLASNVSSAHRLRAAPDRTTTSRSDSSPNHMQHAASPGNNAGIVAGSGAARALYP